MAGTIIADYIRTDANKLSLNVGNTTIASVNSTGLLNSTGGTILFANGQFGTGATLPTSSLTGTITGGQISTAANTIARTSMTSGAILQVVEARTTTAFTLASSTYTDFPSLSVTITPTSTNSRFLLTTLIHGNLTVTADGFGIRFMRNGSSVYSSDATHELYDNASADWYHRQISQYIDSPATTSPVTYKVQVGTWQGRNVIFNYSNYFFSNLLVMEIAG